MNQTSPESVEKTTIDQPEDDTTIKYSAFTKYQKQYMLALVTFAAAFSTLSSFIYYPAITPLTKDLHTTVEKINLTVTSYLIVSAIMPSIIGDAADMLGRRPTYLVILSVYLVANIGLALQRSFTALLLLRMLQSAGVSGTFAVAYGVIADIASPSERGSFVGIVTLRGTTAPCLGPVFGGLLASQGWTWIFWFLSISSAICLSAMFLFLPETARTIVGNGCIPATGLNRLPLLKFMDESTTAAVSTPPLLAERQWHIPNPLKCIYTLFRKDTAIIVCSMGILYMTSSCIQASLSSSFISVYRFGKIESGLVYLPFGVGCASAAYLTGKTLDRDYRLTAIASSLPIDRVRGHALEGFPIEKARLRSIFYPLGVASIAVIGYGWTLESRINVSVPLILQFILGGMMQVCFTSLNTLLIDINPESPSTAQASNNLIRCALAAAVLAILQLIISQLGVGWCFTIFSGICAICAPLLLIERSRGMDWRRARLGD